MPDELIDLLATAFDPHSAHIARESAREQFRAQLIKLIDERIALAAQSAVRSGVAYRLHGDAMMEKWTPPDGAKQISGTISGIANRAGHEPPSGMHDPRK